ncbi:von Willebrand factor D and EGF domain-containing protein-like [Ptychodera flava]|uniref:von Willebrand factor D and EGF domain-containing protein-like n=1 Tax=Ptychodera flava TaxID=63121 RepID=UPI00396A71C1
MAVCINEGGDDCCDSSTNITVKDCGDFYVYKLEPLPMCPSAYCAGDREPCPPGFGSSDGFQPGCSENYPRLEENPIVMPKYNGDAMYGYLECLFAGPITQNVRYTVEWLMDDNAVKTTDVTADSQQDILREDEYVMGCTIKCQVVTHFHDSNILSPAYISNDIFIGIIASPNFITTREDMTGPGHDVSIWATVPMSCKIELQAERFFLDRPEIVFSTCTVDIRHDSYNTLQKVKVDAVRDFQIDGDQLLTVYVKPSDICSVNVKEGYRESITVEVTDVITGRCTSRGDPHYITYDGRGFDSYIIGDFVLQRSQNRDFEVHARTWRCWEVACNCGVVVRENNDVIGVNMCDGEWGKTAPRVIKYSEGNFTAGVSITIDDGGKLFTIAMPSGSRIIAHTYEWGMDIDLTVPSDDFGSTVGLCGVLDDDITNDYTLSDGMISEYTGRDPIDFVSSWMMQPGESLFQSLPDKVGVDRSQRGQSEEQVGCDCSMHVAFDQNQDRHCEHTTGGRARRPVGRQLSSLDVTEEINDMASRLGSSMTTTIDADHGHTEARRTIRRDVQHETDWPTVSGITFQQAEERCRATVLESPIANYCTDIPGVDPFRGVPGCIEDIGLIDGFDLVYVAVEEMIDHCEDVALKNVSLYSNASGSYKPAAFLGDMICPQQCSNHGNCLRGICQCDDEYGGADCSVDLTRPPDVWYIEGSEDHGLCDIRSGLCQSISVIGDNLLNSQTLTCRYEFVKKSGDIWTAIDHNKVDADAVFISFREVYCLPDEIILAVENSDENSGVTSATLRVFISNDAGNTSSNGMLLTIYDSKCLRCESRGLCTLKETACEINGQCFAHGDLHPADAELQCLSDIDQYNWSMRGEVQSSTVWIIGVTVAVVIIAAVGVGGLCILVYKKSGKKKVDAM